MEKSCRNHSSIEIGSSSIFFPLFRSIAGHPIIGADEPTHKAAATVCGNGNGETTTKERQWNGGNRA